MNTLRLIAVMQTLFTANILLAQDLKKVAITDSVEKKVLFEYVQLCEETLHPFALGYGVIKVIETSDSLGQKAWYLKGFYDDRYEENLPRMYAYESNHVILFYDTDNYGREIKRKPTLEELEAWRTLLKGWVLYRPGVMDKWPQHNNMRRYEHTYLDGNSETRYGLEPIISGYRAFNSMTVDFFKDGTYRMRKAL